MTEILNSLIGSQIVEKGQTSLGGCTVEELFLKS